MYTKSKIKGRKVLFSLLPLCSSSIGEFNQFHIIIKVYTKPEIGEPSSGIGVRRQLTKPNQNNG